MGKADKTVIIIALALIAGVFVASRQQRPEAPEAKVAARRQSFTAVIEMSAYRDTSKALGIGYNHMLLKEFAKDYNMKDTIELCPRGQSRVDSLMTGSIDILVLPFTDSLHIEGVTASSPIDSISMWVVRSDDELLLADIEAWLDDVNTSGRFLPVKDRYLKHWSPYKSGRQNWVSPYDSLIKVHADSIGWDWHMMAALIYKESRFHIEAVSVRGATGLMQLMPATARRLGFEELVDPERSIEAGAKLLGRLSDRYRDIAADRVEMEKFALAAYNAGTGRILDCINFARQKGIEPRYWDDILSVLPEMRDSTILDNEAVRLGIFKGEETSSYVNTVLNINDILTNICP